MTFGCEANQNQRKKLNQQLHDPHKSNKDTGFQTLRSRWIVSGFDTRPIFRAKAHNQRSKKSKKQGQRSPYCGGKLSEETLALFKLIREIYEAKNRKALSEVRAEKNIEVK